MNEVNRTTEPETPGFFDPPEGVAGEDAKYFPPRMAMSVAGLGVHVMQGSIFVFYDVPFMIGYNVFALIVWTLGAVLIRRNRPLLGVNVSFWEGYVHINTVVFLYGIETGYHYFFTVGVIAPFLLFAQDSRNHLYAAVVASILAGLAAAFLAPATLPDTLDANTMAAFRLLNWINLPGSLVFLAGLAYYFRISTQRAEDAAEEARRQEAAANRAKSEFLANMSHEIRTPMNAILGYAQILDADRTLNPEHRQSVETIGQSGEHLLGLINDVLDISKIEAGREQLNTADFSLDRMIEGLGGMFDLRCRQKHLTWVCEENIPSGVVSGDEGKLRQVLINLLGNAVKFTDEGAVTLRVTPSGADESAYTFEIIDTGPGIPQDRQAAVFEPFHQDEAGVSHGGTGLGLAISRRYVELMGGSLTVESPVESTGNGSRFSFSVRLPAGHDLPASESDVDWSRVRRLRDGRQVHALVVDDVADNRDVLVRALTRVGATVDTAEDGGQALERIGARMPDIVFMDIRMPGVDGPETLRRIIERHGENAPTVVAATASVFEHQRQQYLDLGFDGFINKPLRFDELYACLARQLDLEFEFEAPEETAAAADWSACRIPTDLHDRFQSAAERHSITELRQHIDELAQVGGAGPLAEYLRELARQFDIEGIADALEQVRQ